MLGWLFRKKSAPAKERPAPPAGRAAAPAAASVAAPPAAPAAPATDWDALLAAAGGDAALLALARTDAPAAIVQAAIGRMEAESALKEAELRFRDKNRGLARLARQRREALAATRMARAEADRIIASARSLADADVIPVNRLGDLGRAWQALDAARLDSAQVEAYAAATAHLAALVRDRADAAVLLEQWSASARAATAALQAGCLEAAAGTRSRGELAAVTADARGLLDAAPPSAPAALRESLQAAIDESVQLDARLALLDRLLEPEVAARGVEPELPAGTTASAGEPSRGGGGGGDAAGDVGAALRGDRVGRDPVSHVGDALHGDDVGRNPAGDASEALRSDGVGRDPAGGGALRGTGQGVSAAAGAEGADRTTDDAGPRDPDDPTGADHDDASLPGRDAAAPLLADDGAAHGPGHGDAVVAPTAVGDAAAADPSRGDAVVAPAAMGDAAPADPSRSDAVVAPAAVGDAPPADPSRSDPVVAPAAADDTAAADPSGSDAAAEPAAAVRTPGPLTARQVAERWRALPPLGNPQLVDALERRVQAWLEARAAAEQARQAARPRVAVKAPRGPRPEALEAATEALARGEAAAADGHVNEARQALADAVRLGRGAADPALHARTDALRAEVARLGDWQRWGGSLAREELVREAEELARDTPRPDTPAERTRDREAPASGAASPADADRLAGPSAGDVRSPAETAQGERPSGTSIAGAATDAPVGSAGVLGDPARTADAPDAAAFASDADASHRPGPASGAGDEAAYPSFAAAGAIPSGAEPPDEAPSSSTRDGVDAAPPEPDATAARGDPAGPAPGATASGSNPRGPAPGATASGSNPGVPAPSAIPAGPDTDLSVPGIAAAGADPTFFVPGIPAAGPDPSLSVPGIPPARPDPSLSVPGIPAAGSDPSLSAPGATGSDPSFAASEPGTARPGRRARRSARAGADPASEASVAGADAMAPQESAAAADASSAAHPAPAPIDRTTAPRTPRVSIRERAEQIDRLRARWKELDRTGGPVRAALWRRFDEALRIAYAPVAEHKAAQQAARAENLAARNRLLDDLAAITIPLPEADGAAPAEWKTVASRLDRFHAEWRKLGPIEHTVPHRERAALLRLLQAPLERVEAPLLAARARAEQERTALVAEARALAEIAASDPGERDLVPRARELQAQWQRHAQSLPLARATESTLWADFRAAIDAVYGARQAAHDAADAAAAQHGAERARLIDQIEAIAPDAPAGEQRRVLADLESRWQRAAPARRQDAAALEARYRRAVDAARARVEGRARSDRGAMVETMRAKLALCEDVERGALARDALAVAWQRLPALPPHWERPLARRAGLESASGRGAAPAPETDRPAGDLLLALEAALHIESPVPLQDARRTLKLQAMKDALEGRARTPAGADDLLAALLGRPGLDAGERERLAAALSAWRARV